MRMRVAAVKNTLNGRQTLFPEPEPAAIDELDVNPINEQRRSAELANPAPSLSATVMRPQECHREQHHDDAELDQDQARAVQPEIDGGIQGVRADSRNIDQRRSGRIRGSRTTASLDASGPPSPAQEGAGADTEREECSPWEEREIIASGTSTCGRPRDDSWGTIAISGDATAMIIPTITPACTRCACPQQRETRHTRDRERHAVQDVDFQQVRARGCTDIRTGTTENGTQTPARRDSLPDGAPSSTLPYRWPACAPCRAS